MAGRQLNTDLVIYNRCSYQQQFGSTGNEINPSLPFEGAKYPHYANKARRLESFYGQTFAGDKNQACDSGLFHTGERDVIQCYKCGVRLQNLVESDDPMKVHAMYSPQCQFVILTKGEKYIKKVCRTDGSLQGWKEKCRLLRLENDNLIADNTKLHADNTKLNAEKTKLQLSNNRLEAENAKLHEQLEGSNKQTASQMKEQKDKLATSFSRYACYNGARPKEHIASNRNSTRGIPESQEFQEPKEVNGTKPKKMTTYQGGILGLTGRYGDRGARDLDVTEPKQADTNQSAVTNDNEIAEESCAQFGYARLDIDRAVRILQAKGKCSYSAEEIASILVDESCERQLEDDVEDEDMLYALKLGSLADDFVE